MVKLKVIGSVSSCSGGRLASRNRTAAPCRAIATRTADFISTDVTWPFGLAIDLHHDVAVLAVHRRLFRVVGVRPHPGAELVAPVRTDMRAGHAREWRGVGGALARREREVQRVRRARGRMRVGARVCGVGPAEREVHRRRECRRSATAPARPVARGRGAGGGGRGTTMASGGTGFGNGVSAVAGGDGGSGGVGSGSGAGTARRRRRRRCGRYWWRRRGTPAGCGAAGGAGGVAPAAPMGPRRRAVGLGSAGPFGVPPSNTIATVDGGGSSSSCRS